MCFFIQIAGIRSLEEACMLTAAGVTHVGFPLRLDVHPQDVSEDEAARIVAKLPKVVQVVVITYETDPDQCVELARTIGAHGLQLHADVEPGCLKRIKMLAPDLFLIKSLVVSAHNRARLVADVKRFSPFVDAFLTDTYDPDTGASGATGRTHDWAVSRELVEISPKPVILAGGLDPDNVAEAVRTVRPAGVDAHTGLENQAGDKDRELVKAFVESAHKVAKSM